MESSQDPFPIDNGVMQGGIPSCILFNVFFDFVIRKVFEEVLLTGVQLAFGSTDFFMARRTF